jgi:hypothetical protein
MFRSYQFFAKVKATSTGKLFDGLPRKEAMAELCSGKFNVAYCRAVIRSENYQHHHLSRALTT